MRDIELMLELLDEMDKDAGGRIMLVQTMGMSEEKRHRRHQAELLADAGLATWESDSMIRITNHGHDFLNAINQDRPTYTDRCKELLVRGKALAEVAAAIVTIVSST